jgi:hypothetical protein
VASRTAGEHEARSRDVVLLGLVFNETWFLIEVGLWFAIAATVLGPGPARGWWAASAIVAIGAATVVGLLSAFDVIGRAVIG